MSKKKLPKTLEAELKYHDFATSILTRMDYNGRNAGQILRSLEKRRGVNWHIGDPCRKCGTPHDAVGIGPCLGQH